MKRAKKTIITLMIALLLTTTIGHAQSFVYTTKIRLFHPNTNGYAINYFNDFAKYFRSMISKFLSDFDWNLDNVEEDDDTQNKPEIPAEPEEETEQPQEPERPNKPEEKPEETEQPEAPAVPEEKPEKPQQPEKPTVPEEKPEEGETEEPSKPVEEPTKLNNQSSSIEREVARLVNLERQKAGLAPLTFSEELARVARIKSQDMADKNYFSHTSPTYGDPFQMMRSFGIKFGYAGENIAKGYRSAESVMNGWMNSSGHRANILNPNFNKIGVGYVEARGTTYWTQLFTD